MARLAELRKTAKDMGIPKAVILRATTASALAKVIAEHSNSKPKAKAKAKKKGTTARKQTRSAPAKKKASGRKASTPARSKGKAKRSSNSNGGRNTLDSVDYSQTDGWNPRAGSAPDRIIKSLRKFRGNRTKVFEALKGDIGDFVAKTKRNGEKHTKASREAMLRYRISRTAWDFAMRTGQHEASTNRAEYGTAGTGEGVWKPAKKRGAQKTSKPAARKPKAKAGRKPAGRKKAAQKPARKAGRPRAKARR